MKKMSLSILILIAILLLAYAALYVYAVYFYETDPATQAYLDEKDPKKKMGLLEKILNEDEYGRWAWLDDASQLAYEIKVYQKARGYAMESLSLSSNYADDWNYGNSIHNANSILGRLSLRDGEIQKAKKYLLEAAKSQGSPQLDTFGPELKLANELLQQGEREAVLEYLSSISKFWEMDNGCVEQWIHEINKNLTPKLCNCSCRKKC